MLTIGQILYYVPQRRHGDPYEVKVVNIGRKWVSFRDVEHGYRPGRCDKFTLEVDDGQYSSPGKLYLSKEIYHKEQVAWSAWRDLQERLSHTFVIPEGLTAEDIIKAGVLLKLFPSAEQPVTRDTRPCYVDGCSKDALPGQNRCQFHT